MSTALVPEETAPHLLLSRLRPSWPLLVGLLALAEIVHAGTLVLGDPDTYLHIASGRWMIAHGALPIADPFSHSMPGARWIPHEWLAELVLALVYGAAGWGGLILLTALCFALSLALLTRYLLACGELYSTLIAVILAALMLLPHVLARPHILALPLLVAWCGSLTATRDEGRSPPLGLLPLMTLWANLHGSFMFGLGVAGFLAIDAGFNPAAGESRWSELKRWGGFCALAALAALLTPNGIAGFLLPFRLTHMKALQNSFVEWLSPNFHDFQALEIYLAALLFAGFSLGVKLPLLRLSFLIGLVHLALAHQRHADLLATAGPLLIWSALGRQFAARLGQTGTSRLAALLGELVPPASRGMTALAMMPIVIAGAWMLHRPIDRTDGSATPAAALAAAQRLGLSGPVFNGEGFGGYLLFNGVPTFIDGRIEMYGDAFLARAVAAERGNADALTGILHDYHITWTLLEPKSGAAQLLDHMPGWRRVYADAYAVVHERSDSAVP